ncbi:tetratricopeptide repeat protein [Synechococcus sp. W60.3]|uniref:tetratricopeptide repeat protein n=1 Tax=Synechococcus sp. W60.3 TaxID=2967125 RepID=UPI0039C5AF95
MTPDALQAGREALQQGRFQEAIQLLEAYLAQSRQRGEAGASDSQALEAQMNLVRAYHQLGETEKARALCLELLQHPDPQARGWAQKILPRLPQTVEKPAASPPSPEPAPEAQPLSSRQRAGQLGLKIPLPERAGPLRWAKWGSLGVGILFLWWLSFVLVGAHLDFGRLSFPWQLWFLQGLLPWLRNGLRWLVAGSLAVNFGVGLLFLPLADGSAPPTAAQVALGQAWRNRTPQPRNGAPAAAHLCPKPAKTAPTGGDPGCWSAGLCLRHFF